jgi:hypothetical protein
MTTLNNLETCIDSSKHQIVDSIYGNAWQMTSYMIQLLHKMEEYTESLSKEYPEADFFTANVAISSAFELINGVYEVPTSDERFEGVKDLYLSTVDDFIRNQSDDAVADLAYLGALANFVCEMRTHAWSEFITETGPSEEKFEALKLAKRDEKAVEIATSAAADAIFSD